MIAVTHITNIVVSGDRQWFTTFKGSYFVVWSKIAGQPKKFQGYWLFKGDVK